MATVQQSEQKFNFHREGNNGRVIVSNSGSYKMAEYDENTGLTRWQRVVPAPQREKVQTFLLAEYPVKAAPAVTKSKLRRAA